MSDIKLFAIQNKVEELQGQSVALEKSLQKLLEENLDTFLGVRFLASEYDLGQNQRGRIDSLGLDENNYPVIIEYKRSTNENVINQGLFYLDWLMDHKESFQWLVMEKLGKEEADRVDWSGPRLICIAGGFTRYDEHAIQQINRNIELIRYKKFNEDFLLLDLVNAVEGRGTTPQEAPGEKKPAKSENTFAECLAKANPTQTELYESIKVYLEAMGDDVTVKELKFYMAFKRIKNFATVEVYPTAKSIIICLKGDPNEVDASAYPEGFFKNMSNTGHLGTGDIQLRILSAEDFERAKPLILASYERS